MKAITPILRPVVVQGRLIYDARSHAFTIIRLKKRIVEEFPQLKKDQHWRYTLEFWPDYDLTVDRIIEAYRKQENPPLLVFVYPEQ